MIKQELKVTILILLCIPILALSENMLRRHNSANCLGTASSARVIMVPENFTRIQDAIDHALDGDTIIVQAGTYNESLVINRSISLIGMGRNCTIIKGRTDAHVITISADNVTIDGFSIINGETGKLGTHVLSGIRLDDVNSVTLKDNTVTGNFVGIFLGDKNQGSHENIIENNYICRNRYGIFLAWSNENVICGNTISNSLWNGIELAWSDRNVLYGNVISNNTAHGLEIPLPTPSRHNTCYGNNFINNTPNVFVSTYANTWDQGYPSGGNYWSDYESSDRFHGTNQTEEGADGVGDTWYHIDKNNRDRYPLTHPVSAFRTLRINGEPSYIYVTSNSTISHFDFNPEKSPILKFNVTPTHRQTLFCRITILKSLLWSNDTWNVYADDEPVDATILEDSENTYVFLVYTPESNHTRTIKVVGTGSVPEFGNLIVYLLVVLTTTSTIIAFTVHTKKNRKLEEPTTLTNYRKIDISARDVEYDLEWATQYWIAGFG